MDEDHNEYNPQDMTTMMTFDQMQSDLGKKKRMETKMEHGKQGNNQNETIMMGGGNDTNTSSEMNMSSDVFN